MEAQTVTQMSSTESHQLVHHRPRAYRHAPILRVRTGCLTCRRRKKKCDEIKPICTGCSRNQFTCSWPGDGDSPQDRRTQLHRRLSRDRPETAGGTSECLPSGSRSELTSQITEAPNPRGQTQPECRIDSTGPWNISDFPDVSPFPIGIGASPDILSESTPSSDSTPRGGQDVVDSPSSQPASPNTQRGVMQRTSGSFSQIPSPPRDSDCLLGSPMAISSIPSSITLLPGLPVRSFDLLGHYISRTAISMGNGSTSANPFVDQIVPLMFANKLVLQLILTQSAAHQAVAKGETLDVAQREYAESLGLLQSAIEEYIDGRERSPLWVTVGALIMCYTETTRGDVNGTIFDHLSATGPLIAQLITHPGVSIQHGLKDFIVEYYIYTGLISMISIDPAYCAKPLLEPKLVTEAKRLASTGYIGHLCGCWLPLLLLIPEIFRFGRRALEIGSEDKFPVLDDFLTFSSIQNQLLSFESPPTVSRNVAICASVYRNAIHLYLLSAIGHRERRDGHSAYHKTISATALEAMESLRPLAQTARINTSLCWAIAVIGCCVKDEGHRDELRTRLGVMFQTIGLGNILSTASLLEMIWQRPLYEQTPWIIHEVMQDNQMWISFA